MEELIAAIARGLVEDKESVTVKADEMCIRDRIHTAEKTYQVDFTAPLSPEVSVRV